MVKAFADLTKKQKWVFLLLLVLGYLSPAIGLLAFIFVRKKTEIKLLRNAPLVGAGLAMLVYIVDYMYLLWA